MGTGYTRADTGNNIADGNIINAEDLDGEFDALQTAFNEITGHTHDGTSAEGAPITFTGPAQEYVSTGTELRPKTNNTYDLGSAANQWKNLYVDGTANIDSLVADTADINGGTIDGTVVGGATPAAGTFTTVTATGNVTLGDAATDTVTVNADIASDLIPSVDGTYDLGAAGSEWQDLFIDGTANIDSLVADTADINGGTIDGVTIGGAVAGAITGTTGTFSGYLSIADKIVHSGDTNTAIRFPAADTVTVETSAGERLRVNSVGDVGIGTTSPTTKLQVAGGVRIGNAGTYDMKLLGNTSTAVAVGGSTLASILSTYGISSAAGHVGIEVPSNDTNDGFYIATDANQDGVVDTLALKINAAGYVGIGTSTPGSKLSIVGLPTSSAGLSAGDIWNDGGTLKIV